MWFYAGLISVYLVSLYWRFMKALKPLSGSGGSENIWEFPKIRGTLFGVLIIRILLFRALC